MPRVSPSHEGVVSDTQRPIERTGTLNLQVEGRELLSLGAGGPARGGRAEVCDFHGQDGHVGGADLRVTLKGSWHQKHRTLSRNWGERGQ